jgi:ubiquinone/menaquinone biosynthesis C-methylase UbiE
MRRVADLGCGTGQFAGRVAETWPLVTVTGLDMFEGHLRLAREAFPAETHPNVSFEQGDARETGWPADHYDAVAIRHVLHALPDVDVLLAESMRILKPGGLLYVLAEDYAGLIFDTPGEAAQRLFYDATPALMQHGTNLFHGRAAYRELREAGFEGVRIEPLLVDTANTPRETFARMMRFWRDGYAGFIAESGGFEPEEIRARFDSIIESLEDADRYGCWLLFCVTGRAPQ